VRHGARTAAPRRILRRSARRRSRPPPRTAGAAAGSAASWAGFAGHVAEAAAGRDDVDAELAADAADQHLDGVALALDILGIEMLGQLELRYHTSGMMHQVAQQPLFLRRHVYPPALHPPPHLAPSHPSPA